MTLEAALSLQPDAVVLEADEPHYGREFERVLRALEDVSDRVEATALEELRTSPIGTGPFQLSSWENERSTVLTPFQDSWQRREDGGPYALPDELQIRDHPGCRSSEPRRSSPAMSTPSSHRTVRSDCCLDNDDLTSVVRKGSLHLSWWVNHELYPANNVDFRRALMHAWDKEGANEVFYEGRADAWATRSSPAVAGRTRHRINSPPSSTWRRPRN